MVENKGGQSGNLGAEFVYGAEPDGYTLLASQPAPITTSPLLFKKLNFDPTKFEPIAVMSAIANTLLVASGLPGQATSRSSSPTSRPIPASSTTPRKATAPPRI